MMGRPFRCRVDDLPAERRDRIEAHTRTLVKEYDLLEALRQDRHVTETRLADLMGIRQFSTRTIEDRTDLHLSTLRTYVEALGGERGVRARFPDDVSLDALVRSTD